MIWFHGVVTTVDHTLGLVLLYSISTLVDNTLGLVWFDLVWFSFMTFHTFVDNTLGLV